MKGYLATISLYARVTMANFCVSFFAEVNCLQVMRYERNDSLRVSSGRYSSVELHEQKVSIKLAEQLPCDLLNLAALQDKTLSDGSPPLSFEKALYLALL